MEELRVEDPQSFFNYLRMESAMFNELVQREWECCKPFLHISSAESDGDNDREA